MPKRPDTIETTVMALEILRRIPRNQFISTSDLHTQLHDAGFERDVRTIQRQLDMLAEHFNIERDTRSKPYGYKWKEIPNGFGIAAMTQQESLLLTLAEQHLHSLLPPSVLKVMDRFFEQARNNLKPHTNAKLEREWLFKVRSVRETLPLLPPKINPEVLEEVSTALYENKWLQIDYKNSLNESKNSRKVMPLGLVQQGHCLYLVCRFDGYDNERNLALHRFQSAQVTTQAFA